MGNTSSHLMEELCELRSSVGNWTGLFSLRLMKVLDFVTAHPSPEVVIQAGVRWVTDDVFEVRACVLASLFNLKPNSLNRNLRGCGFVTVTKNGPMPRGTRLMRHRDGIIRRGAKTEDVKKVTYVHSDRTPWQGTCCEVETPVLAEDDDALWPHEETDADAMMWTQALELAGII